MGDPVNRHRAIQVIRAAGWHHSIGRTIGNVPYEAILCRACVKEEYKRPKKTLLVDQEESLPIEWDKWRKDESGPGGHSR